MSWSLLAMQFGMELAFGVLLALAFVPTAPVGRFFYRVLGTTAMIPALAVVLLPAPPEAESWVRFAKAGAVLVLLAFPAVSIGPLGRLWRPALSAALIGSAASVALLLRAAGLDALQLTLGTLSALATGAVAGSVGLAMVLGHWYLTVPKLEIAHLGRLNRVTIVAMAASLALLVVSSLAFREALQDVEVSAWGAESDMRSWNASALFLLATRAAVGLVLPLVFAWMVADSLRFANTRSATGILYASTVLVLIGTALSLTFQDSFGVPL